MIKNINSSSLDHLNLTVQNYGETLQWYTQIFGFEEVEYGLTKEGRPWGIVRNGDSMLCFYEDPGRKLMDGAELELYHQISHFGLRIKDKHTWDRSVRDRQMSTYYGSPWTGPLRLHGFRRNSGRVISS